MSERDKPMYGYEVSAAFRESPAMMTAAKAWGYVFQYGSKTTLRHYSEWRTANPNFRVTSYVRAHTKKKLSRVKGLSQKRRGRKAETARNHDGQ